MNKASVVERSDFELMRNYIEGLCGISLNEDKIYLLKSRFAKLMAEYGCTTLFELYQKAVNDQTKRLRDRIIDAITTNETLWFRDQNPFLVLSQIILKKMVAEISSGKRSNIRIWSAGCSTGQEPYSIAITALEYIRRDNCIKPEHLEIIATDISHQALGIAKAGKYNSLAISRGLPDEIKKRYFNFDGKFWTINDTVKNMVTFYQKDIRESFDSIMKQDVIFCRNVLIYFSTQYKKEILQGIAHTLRPGGYLFLGGAESVMFNSNAFRMKIFNNGCLYYQVE